MSAKNETAESGAASRDSQAARPHRSYIWRFYLGVLEYGQDHMWGLIDAKCALYFIVVTAVLIFLFLNLMRQFAILGQLAQERIEQTDVMFFTERQPLPITVDFIHPDTLWPAAVTVMISLNGPSKILRLIHCMSQSPAALSGCSRPPG